MFMGFITTPLYIYCILWLESALEDQKLNFKEGSTQSKVEIDGWFCIAKDMGNITEWARIEVLTFYLNITVMIFYLIAARLLPEKEQEKTDESDDK
jgi:phage shock protein PspC (stress-responsive transcriptional regulator)